VLSAEDLIDPKNDHLSENKQSWFGAKCHVTARRWYIIHNRYVRHCIFVFASSAFYLRLDDIR